LILLFIISDLTVLRPIKFILHLYFSIIDILQIFVHDYDDVAWKKNLVATVKSTLFQ